MSDTIITLNCLLLPRETALRSELSEGSITTLKISTDETVDQLRTYGPIFGIKFFYTKIILLSKCKLPVI